MLRGAKFTPAGPLAAIVGPNVEELPPAVGCTTRRVLLASLAASLIRAQSREMERQARAVAALSDSFESVFYSKRNTLTLSQSGIVKQNINALDVPFVLLLQGFTAADARGATASIGNIGGSLTGAKNFRAPKSLGGVQSDICSIGILRGPGGFDLGAHLPGLRPDVAGEIKVWKWSGPPTEEGSVKETLYATQIGQAYVVLANSLSELQSIAKQLDRSLGAKLTLDHIPEWNFLRPRASWAYRRYRRDETTDIHAAGLSVVPADAYALMLFFDSATKGYILRLFTSETRENRAIRVARQLLPFRLVTAGVWETTFQLYGDEVSLERLVLVLGMFGFGVYL